MQGGRDNDHLHQLLAIRRIDSLYPKAMLQGVLSASCSPDSLPPPPRHHAIDQDVQTRSAHRRCPMLDA
jgi:hypothetical protein